VTQTEEQRRRRGNGGWSGTPALFRREREETAVPSQFRARVLVQVNAGGRQARVVFGLANMECRRGRRVSCSATSCSASLVRVSRFRRSRQSLWNSFAAPSLLDASIWCDSITRIDLSVSQRCPCKAGDWCVPSSAFRSLTAASFWRVGCSEAPSRSGIWRRENAMLHSWDMRTMSPLWLRFPAVMVLCCWPAGLGTRQSFCGMS
jgi:hypothetical protein